MDAAHIDLKPNKNKLYPLPRYHMRCSQSFETLKTNGFLFPREKILPFSETEIRWNQTYLGMISPFSGTMFTPKRIEILGVGFSPNGPANSNSAPLRPPDWGNDFLDPSWILIIYYRLSWKLTKGTPSNVPPPKSPPQWWRVLSIRDAFKPPQKTCCQCWPIAGGDPPGLFRFSIPLEDI